jgi:rubrerythrin
MLFYTPFSFLPSGGLMTTESNAVASPNNKPSALSPDYRYDAINGETEILWKCLRCGELMPRGLVVPDFCPSCGAPKTEFVLLGED